MTGLFKPLEEFADDVGEGDIVRLDGGLRHFVAIGMFAGYQPSLKSFWDRTYANFKNFPSDFSLNLKTGELKPRAVIIQGYEIIRKDSEGERK